MSAVPNRMRQISLAVAAGAVLAITAACGKSDGPTGPSVPATPVGTYSLSTIDAKAMPYTMYADTGYTLVIQSGTLSVTAGGRWVSKIVQVETVAGFPSTYSDSTFGTWSQPVGTTSAVFTNTETKVTSTVSWTSGDITVNDVDGSTTRRVLYKRN